MKKIASVILSSVLMLDLCGAAYEVKPAAINELTPSYQTSAVKTGEKLVYSSPFIPHSATRPELDGYSSTVIKDNAKGQSSQGPAIMPYYDKNSVEPVIMPYYNNDPIKGTLLNEQASSLAK